MCMPRSGLEEWLGLLSRSAGQVEDWRSGSPPSCGAPRERMGRQRDGRGEDAPAFPLGMCLQRSSSGQGGKVLKLVHEEGQAGAESRRG